MTKCENCNSTTEGQCEICEYPSVQTEDRHDQLLMDTMAAEGGISLD